MTRRPPPHEAITGLSHPMAYQAAVAWQRHAERMAVEVKPVGNSVYGPDGPSTAWVSPLDGRAK
jgi:hypothetical protein